MGSPEPGFLALPESAFLQIQAAAGDPSSVSALESLAKSAPRFSETAWAGILEDLFPSLFVKLLGTCFKRFDSRSQALCRRFRWQLQASLHAQGEACRRVAPPQAARREDDGPRSPRAYEETPQ